MKLALPGQPPHPAEVMKTSNHQEVLVVILKLTPVATSEQTEPLQVRKRILHPDTQAAHHLVVGFAQGGEGMIAPGAYRLANIHLGILVFKSLISPVDVERDTCWNLAHDATGAQQGEVSRPGIQRDK